MDFKPIGHIESGFKFKNGTPRQPSVCDSARARLTINNDTYSNPGHSIEGLENFSHVWVVFVFHKNNNAYKKAKVKPPRLNGAKVGVFSTRSPYRLNPIGLTLAKIESIEGPTVHLSGVDMLDGTPVLDIKPYIPLYDQPNVVAADALQPETEGEIDNDADDEDVEAEMVGTGSKLGSAATQEVGSGNRDTYSALGQNTVQTESSSVGNNPKGSGPVLDTCNEQQPESCQAESVDITTDSIITAPSTDRKAHDQHLVPAEEPYTTCSASNERTAPQVEGSDAGSSQAQVAGPDNQVEFADWIKAPPFHKLTVRWTPTADTQLKQFSKEAPDDRYQLEFIQSTDEAKKAVHDILHADPRSSYRRKKCVDRLYFFMVDVLHVTCWFNDDESVVEVVRIKPNREKMLQKLAGER